MRRQVTEKTLRVLVANDEDCGLLHVVHHGLEFLVVRLRLQQSAADPIDMPIADLRPTSLLHQYHLARLSSRRRRQKYATNNIL